MQPIPLIMAGAGLALIVHGILLVRKTAHFSDEAWQHGKTPLKSDAESFKDLEIPHGYLRIILGSLLAVYAGIIAFS
ncbi:MAG: hypothetical protein ACLUCU_01465 [Slackia sp.]